MNEITRTPQVIATEINIIKDQTRKMVLYNSIEIGRKLVEAKELVPAGEFGKWLEEAVDYSSSTANNLMKIFKEYGSEQTSLLDNNVKSPVFEKLNYSQAIALFAVPEEEREEFIEENHVEDMSARELKAKIAELKAREDENNKLKEELESTKKSKENMEAQVKKEKENKQKLKDQVEELKNQITKANEEVNPVIDKLNKEVEEANKKIEELENRPIEVITSNPSGEEEEARKKLEEEVLRLQKEKEAAENKIKDIQEKQKIGNAVLSKFTVYLEDITNKFNNILDLIEDEENTETKDKLHNATIKLLERMRENI